MFTIRRKQPAPFETMADPLDLIKLELVSEYQDSGRVDIADWVRRYPEFRGELLDFWIALKGTREIDNADGNEGEPSTHDGEIYERALRDACLAITLGPQWLAPAVDPEIENLASDLAILRQTPKVRDAKRLAFPKAVVCTWVVLSLQRSRSRVTRLAVQKVSYLLEQAIGLGIFVEHNQKPLGPYDSNARYKDAEPIAKAKGWLMVDGTELVASPPKPEMTKFLSGYLRSESVATRLVERLSGFSDDQLETMATVHWVGRDLVAAGAQVDLDSVVELLAQTPVWKPKLARSNFSRSSVSEALAFLGGLRLVATTVSDSGA